MKLADADKDATSDDDIIYEAKKFLAHVIEMDGENRKEALEDLRFLSGDQWDDADVRSRSMPGAVRPMLTINKLPTFLHQVTNDLRQNVPGIKVSPVDDGADEDIAKTEQGLIRHIEYDSNAEAAYDTAVHYAAAIGFGYFRLNPEDEGPTSFDQVIRFKRIRNPLTVYFDPASEEADGSDQRRCMISTRINRKVFHLEYPQADKPHDTMDFGAGDNGEWGGKDFVRVAEYYRVVEKADTLVQLSDGSKGFKSDIQDMNGTTIVREKPSFKRTIEWYKLTGLEILDKTIIKCQWIPVYPVYGDELDIDGKVMRSGLIRNAKDPQKMYNYTMTSATEEVSTRNKIPYIGALGQFEGLEGDWAAANTTNLPYLEYNPVTIDGTMAPAPQRQPMADIPNGLLTLALHANDNIKATTGLFDSSLGAKGNATSGIQEQAQQRQGDLANFHYADNLVRSIRHAGRCLIDMIPSYYDAARVIKIMGEDGTVSHANVNQPNPDQQPDPQTGAIQTVLNDLTVGTYDVSVSTGPSYSTMRQEAADGMIQLGKNWPKLMDVAGDKVIASLDWPGADGIAKRVKATIPPNITQVDDDNNDDEQQPMVPTSKGPVPVQQAGQLIEQLDQENQQLHQQLQDAQAGITKQQVVEQGRMQHGQMKGQTDAALLQMKQQHEAAMTAAQQQHDAQMAQFQARQEQQMRDQDSLLKKDIAELQGTVQLLVARMATDQKASQAEAQLEQDSKQFVAAQKTAQTTAQPAVKSELSKDL